MAELITPEQRLKKYCSCVFQNKSKKPKSCDDYTKAELNVKAQKAKLKGYSKMKKAELCKELLKDPNPYAICTFSNYTRAKLKGPGAVACRFDRSVLDTYDDETLEGWLRAEGLKKIPRGREARLDYIEVMMQRDAKRKGIKKVHVDERVGHAKKSPVAVKRRRRRPSRAMSAKGKRLSPKAFRRSM